MGKEEQLGTHAAQRASLEVRGFQELSSPKSFAGEPCALFGVCAGSFCDMRVISCLQNTFGFSPKAIHCFRMPEV